MSIVDRLGVDLGSVLGVIFGRFGALVGQSWSQSRLRTVLTSKKWVFKKTSATEGESTILRSKSAQDGTQDDPRSPQDGSKIVLDRFFSSWFFASIFDRFGIDFGDVLASQMAPGEGRWAVLIGSGAVQDGPKIVWKFDSRWVFLYKTRHLVFYSFLISLFFLPFKIWKFDSRWGILYKTRHLVFDCFLVF